MAGSTLTRRSFPASLWNEPRGLLEDFQHKFSQMLDEGVDYWTQGPFGMSVDVAETDNAIEAKVDLPGVAPKDIDISLNGNVLTVSGQRKDEREEKGKTFHRVERSSGRFSRAFTLPCQVEEDEVAAVYRDGVLTITLPKNEVARTRRIAVKT